MPKKGTNIEEGMGPGCVTSSSNRCTASTESTGFDVFTVNDCAALAVALSRHHSLSPQGPLKTPLLSPSPGFIPKSATSRSHRDHHDHTHPTFPKAPRFTKP